MKQPFKESTARWMQCIQSNRHLHHWSKSTDYGFINPMNLNQCMSDTMSLWANEIRLHAWVKQGIRYTDDTLLSYVTFKVCLHVIHPFWNFVSKSWLLFFSLFQYCKLEILKKAITFQSEILRILPLYLFFLWHRCWFLRFYKIPIPSSIY